MTEQDELIAKVHEEIRRIYDMGWSKGYDQGFKAARSQSITGKAVDKSGICGKCANISNVAADPFTCEDCRHFPGHVDNFKSRAVTDDMALAMAHEETPVKATETPLNEGITHFPEAGTDARRGEHPGVDMECTTGKLVFMDKDGPVHKNLKPCPYLENPDECSEQDCPKNATQDCYVPDTTPPAPAHGAKREYTDKDGRKITEYNSGEVKG